MTDEDKRQVKNLILAKAKERVQNAVATEQQRTGGRFQTAWSRVKEAQPELFDALDQAGDGVAALNDELLERGRFSGQPFYRPLADPEAENNTPSGPNAKPHNDYPPDSRLPGAGAPAGSRLNPARPRDARIVGSWVRDLVASVGRPVRVQASRGTICVRNPYSWQ
jgi:hypothetical protein